MDSMYFTSYSDNNQSNREVQDIVKRVFDSVAVMLEKQLQTNISKK